MRLILIITIINLYSYANDISTIRELYVDAYKSDLNCNKLGEILDTMKKNSSTLIKGYEGCFYFFKCKFESSPISKLIYFKKGKKLLENAIALDPYSVELKFLRYNIQTNLPKFLSYHNKIEEDYNFINQNIKKISDKKAKWFIINSLKSINR